MSCLKNYTLIAIIFLGAVFILTFPTQEDFAVYRRRNPHRNPYRNPSRNYRRRFSPYYPTYRPWYWSDYVSPWSWYHYWKRPYNYSQVSPVVDTI
jgi:hypothetical protein